MAQYFTNGMNQADLPLTGSERIPLDTMSSDYDKQQAYATPEDIKDFVQGGSVGTAAATAGAATLNSITGTVTSEALTTAAGATYTLTLTNSKIAADSVVLASVGNGTNAAGSPAITTVTVAANSVVIVIQNIAAAAAFNGTLKIGFTVLFND